ncbi:hypothetical protein O6H91_08G002900 [Diphasiastrum complanatum]|uniref:Uncharacterized protein n=1 Tax=Diphasiastrum complanatum TaxID=34168 RepID=A0ACC2CUC2_DIPCM|nr:hypothetical protein O6H91_08G002900 [Diphasiastrum complanatum]
MDLFYQKARILAQETMKKSQQMAKEAAKASQDFALETAKRSQEIAFGTAKLSQELAAETAKKSQEIALQTAKRSKELAAEATKKADEFKAFAGQLAPMSPSTTFLNFTDAKPSVNELELEEYGITEELREFVKGLTMQTFIDFPLDDTDMSKIAEKQTAGLGNSAQDLTDWQERHAILVLSTVKEISNFRYLLCPRRMQESRFWKIYFVLVHGHVAPYEMKTAKYSGVEQSTKEEAATSGTTTSDPVVKDIVNSIEQGMLQSTKEEAVTSATTTSDPVVEEGTVNTPSEQGISGLEEGRRVEKPSSVDQDLDAYLMEVLGSSDDDGPDVANGDGSDVDFEELVNMEADDEEVKV